MVGGSRYTITIPGSHPLAEAWMDCRGEAVEARVYERASADIPAEVAPAG